MSIAAAARRILLCALLTFYWAGRAFAADAPDGLLYVAHFDEYPGANWAVGTRAFAGPISLPRFVEGKFGKALPVGRRRGFALVGDDGNFSHAQGTVEMWIRPNWDGNDGKVRQLFGASAGPKNYLNSNKLADGRLGVATGSAGAGPYRRIDRDVSAWKAGEWHHVAFTWGGGKLALFVDGKKIGEADGSIPPKRAMSEIRIASSLDGAIDELAIWSVPRESFALSAPISAPEMGAVGLPTAGPPPVGEIDRFHFALPTSPKGYAIATKYFVDEVDPKLRPETLGQEPKLSTFAARDEWQSVGFVIYAGKDLKRVKIEATPLRGSDGSAIGAEDIGVFLNRRAMRLRAPRVPKDDRVPGSALLDPPRPLDLPADHFKEATVTVRVPAEAKAGVYRGAVLVSAQGSETTSIPLEVRVLPFRLRPSRRKEYGVYLVRVIDLDPAMRDSLRADLKDLRDHGVTKLFCHLGIDHRKDGDRIVTSYERLDRGLALLREFGFDGTIVIQDGLLQLAQLLGHKDVAGRDAKGESLDGDEEFARHAERAIRGLAPLKEKYSELELVVTHMDEVLGKKRLPLYIRLTKPIRRVPEQRVYITLHTMPRSWVPERTKELDPHVDVRCYNGHALDLWIQAGHTFEELAQELERAGDEGWMYYNPHRPFYTAKWSRIVNGLYMWWSPLHVHCPFRYRTMRTYPLSFSHNMGYSVKSQEDFTTPIATRPWEGFRLGAQDAWYFCMLEDLVAKGQARPMREAEAAAAWLRRLRALMPAADKIQEIAEKQCRDYPVVYTVAKRLDGKAMAELRLNTAKHIIALREALGVRD